VAVPDASAPARTRTSSEEVEDVVRNLILDSVFKPGARLSDQRLSIDLGVGRTAIREALARLNKEGLVELIPNRGAFVRNVNGEQVIHLFEAREVLETHAARLAAVRATPQRLKALNETLAITRISLGESGGAYPVTLDFHDHVIDMSGNPVLIQLARDVNRQLRLARNHSGNSPERAGRAFDEHVRIFDAIQRGDGDGAALAMHDHIEGARAQLNLQIEKTESETYLS
jgi:DNA-binding GntR family transcriptional regulator